MWLFTRYGFYSIACGNAPDGSLDPDVVMVRARQVDHLRELQNRFPQLADVQIVTMPHRDYRYRLVVAKELWVGLVAEIAREQQWSNFKDEAARYQGRAGSDYVHSLHNVWRVMYDLQEGARRTAIRSSPKEP